MKTGGFFFCLTEPRKWSPGRAQSHRRPTTTSPKTGRVGGVYNMIGYALSVWAVAAVGGYLPYVGKHYSSNDPAVCLLLSLQRICKFGLFFLLSDIFFLLPAALPDASVSCINP